MKIRKNRNDYFIVSLLKRKPFHIKFWLCIVLTIVTAVLFSSISKAAVAIRLLRNLNIFLFLGYLFLLFIMWKWYFKHGRCRYPYPPAGQLRYFLEANKLYEMGYKEKQDRSGKIVKEKIIVNSAYLGCWEDEKQLIIRAYKQGDVLPIK